MPRRFGVDLLAIAKSQRLVRRLALVDLFAAAAFAILVGAGSTIPIDVLGPSLTGLFAVGAIAYIILCIVTIRLEYLMKEARGAMWILYALGMVVPPAGCCVAISVFSCTSELLRHNGVAVGALGARAIHIARIRSGVCRSCGYDLSGLRSNRCPECGTSFPA